LTSRVAAPSRARPRMSRGSFLASCTAACAAAKDARSHGVCREQAAACPRCSHAQNALTLPPREWAGSMYRMASCSAAHRRGMATGPSLARHTLRMMGRAEAPPALLLPAASTVEASNTMPSKPCKEMRVPSLALEVAARRTCVAMSWRPLCLLRALRFGVPLTAPPAGGQQAAASQFSLTRVGQATATRPAHAPLKVPSSRTTGCLFPAPSLLPSASADAACCCSCSRLPRTLPSFESTMTAASPVAAHVTDSSPAPCSAREARSSLGAWRCLLAPALPPRIAASGWPGGGLGVSQLPRTPAGAAARPCRSRDRAWRWCAPLKASFACGASGSMRTRSGRAST